MCTSVSRATSPQRLLHLLALLAGLAEAGHVCLLPPPLDLLGVRLLAGFRRNRHRHPNVRIPQPLFLDRRPQPAGCGPRVCGCVGRGGCSRLLHSGGCQRRMRLLARPKRRQDRAEGASAVLCDRGARGSWQIWLGRRMSRVHEPRGRRRGIAADIPHAVMVSGTVASPRPAPHASAGAQQPAAESLRWNPSIGRRSATPHALHRVM